jgi:hypothetical protein
VQQLAAGGQHWVPILDIGMPPADDYPAFAEGTAANVWIRDVDGNPYLGQVGLLLGVAAAESCAVQGGAGRGGIGAACTPPLLGAFGGASPTII